MRHSRQVTQIKQHKHNMCECISNRRMYSCDVEAYVPKITTLCQLFYSTNSEWEVLLIRLQQALAQILYLFENNIPCTLPSPQPALSYNTNDLALIMQSQVLKYVPCWLNNEKVYLGIMNSTEKCQHSQLIFFVHLQSWSNNRKN